MGNAALTTLDRANLIQVALGFLTETQRSLLIAAAAFELADPSYSGTAEALREARSLLRDALERPPRVKSDPATTDDPAGTPEEKP